WSVFLGRSISLELCHWRSQISTSLAFSVAADASREPVASWFLTLKVKETASAAAMLGWSTKFADVMCLASGLSVSVMYFAIVHSSVPSGSVSCTLLMESLLSQIAPEGNGSGRQFGNIAAIHPLETSFRKSITTSRSGDDLSACHPVVVNDPTN